MMLVTLLRRAWFGVGPVATLRAAIKRVRRADAEAHRPAESQPTGPHPFDAAFGVDTGGFVDWRNLQTGGRNDAYISPYFGVTPSIARRLIAAVDRPEEHVFIDLGCGKGRAAIIASELPFRRVIGVEIAPSLAGIARANARVIAERFPARTAIEVANADAAAFDLPPDPLALFLYQPFERPVLRAVLERLRASLAARPRPAILLYVNPVLAPIVDGTRWLERRDESFDPELPEERPFTYGGRGGVEHVAIWATRSPRPGLLALRAPAS